VLFIFLLFLILSFEHSSCMVFNFLRGNFHLLARNFSHHFLAIHASFDNNFLVDNENFLGKFHRLILGNIGMILKCWWYREYDTKKKPILPLKIPTSHFNQSNRKKRNINSIIIYNINSQTCHQQLHKKICQKIYRKNSYKKKVH
jgi:hypothetical protein